jgi:predicted polyphosphate/ATP-dependent NAD kinase
MRIGLVVNPNSGLGGAVGLKGTDGPDTVAEAFRRGAVPKAGARARIALERLGARLPGASLHVAAGILGADWAQGLPLDLHISPAQELTGTARDTLGAVTAMLPLDVVVFAGGDGTARDVMSVAPRQTAILGIPCGVKMHSGVFAVTPGAAGSMMADLLSAQDRVAWNDEAEVMDIDEAVMRTGVIAPRLYGLARVPVSRNLMQAAKGGPRINAGAALSSAAAEIVGEMQPETLYVIGPGTSAGTVMKAAGHTPTTLGVDAMLNGKVVARDTDSQSLDALAGDRPVRLVLGVTGQQGFLLGRGNQQIGPHLIAHAGRDGLIVLATEDKLVTLSQPRLLVDTGNPALDTDLSGFIRVRTGAGRQMMMRVTSC